MRSSATIGAVDQLYAALNHNPDGSARAEASLRSTSRIALMVAGDHDEARIQAEKATGAIALLGSVRQRRRLARVRVA